MNKKCIGRDLNKPFKSNREGKKLQVCVRDKDGQIRNIHFGATGYSDFTIHKDIKRRAAFRARHKCDPVSKLDKNKPKYWACEFLWGKR